MKVPSVFFSLVLTVSLAKNTLQQEFPMDDDTPSPSPLPQAPQYTAQMGTTISESDMFTPAQKNSDVIGEETNTQSAANGNDKTEMTENAQNSTEDLLGAGEENPLSGTGSQTAQNGQENANFTSSETPPLYQSATEMPLEEQAKLAEEECAQPDTLDRYSCTDIPQSVVDYFDGDMSVRGLLKQFFNDNVTESLHKCTEGGWCLPYTDHEEVKDNLKFFYMEGPFCSDAMKCSLNKMLSSRYICGDESLTYLVNSLELMCDLRKSEEPEQEQPCGDIRECYARAKEALYVLYEDVLSPNPQHEEAMLQDDCNDYKVEVTKTYFCASKCCQFAQREILERFELWKGLSDTEVAIYAMCNITDDCEANRRQDVNLATDGYPGSSPYPIDYPQRTEYNLTLEEEEEEAQIAEEILEDDMEEISEVIGEMEKEGNQSDNVDVTEGEFDAEGDLGNFDGMNEEAGPSEDDHTMLFGVVTTASLILLSLLLIILVGCRKLRHSRASGYRRGYSQLTEEETRMLKNEYN